MSDLEDFGNWIDQNEPVFTAWGNFVVSKICELVKASVDEETFKTLFKVPPNSRPKDRDSAIKKQKKKNYANPKEQMTDLVGARFVVLLKTQIDLVEDAVINYSGWSRSRDRSPEHEQSDNPRLFDYQSVHYVVRNNQDRDHDGIKIPAGTPCEVQIRTLLQHAYAELVHDKFYKADHPIPATAERIVARCMALMESTDHMFCAAVDELNQVNQTREAWCTLVDAQVGPIIGAYTSSDQDPDALEIVETFHEFLTAANSEEVRSMLSQCADAIGRRAPQGGLFAKPVVLLVYWLVANHSFEVSTMWPVASLRSGLESVMADLGAG